MASFAQVCVLREALRWRTAAAAAVNASNMDVADIVDAVRAPVVEMMVGTIR